MNNTEIISAAIEEYGKLNQLVVAVEELSELQKEICKFIRGDGSREHIAEEIADVSIMLAQLEEIFDIRTSIDYHYGAKMLRLESRIMAKRGERT